MDSLQMQVPSSSSGGTITVQDEGVTQSTTVTTLNFTGAGVTASGGGATVTVDIPGGGGGGSSITAASVTVSSPALEASVTIVDASITATDRINVTWGNCSQEDENHPSMGPIEFNAIPGSGQFTLEIYSGDQSMLYGVFKINYDRAA